MPKITPQSMATPASAQNSSASGVNDSGVNVEAPVMAARHFIGKDTIFFAPCFVKSLNLDIKELITCGYPSKTEEAHVKNCLLNRLIER
jgi:hypothetical protein